MKAGTRLQEVGMQQWVNVENWRGDWSKSVGEDMVVDLFFDVINPTALPLTLLAVTVSVRGQRIDSAGKALLAPNSPHAGGYYIYYKNCLTLGHDLAGDLQCP
jgi:hypothetical protein